MLKKIALGALAPVAVLGTLALGGAAHAATTPTPTPTATPTGGTWVTHISAKPDHATSNATPWATDNFDIKLVVTPDTVSGACGSSPFTGYCYQAQVSSYGSFVTTPYALAPNQGGKDAGSTITHKVPGKFTGTSTYTFTSTLASPKPTNVLLNGEADKSGAEWFGDWFLQAYPGATLYNPNALTATYKYATYVPGTSRVCESWLDNYTVPTTGPNADNGQLASDGNITGKVCPKPAPAPKPQPTPFPHLTHGHILNVGYNVAQIGWDYVGYPKGQLQCALTETYGYGFSTDNQPIKFTFVPKGFAMDKNAHVGFTCYNPTKLIDQPSGDVGFWWGLAAHHTYDILVIPATPNRQPITGSPVGWVNIVTR